MSGEKEVAVSTVRCGPTSREWCVVGEVVSTKGRAIYPLRGDARGIDGVVAFVTGGVDHAGNL